MASAAPLHPQVNVDLDSVEGIISRGQYQPDVKDEPLRARMKISDVWPKQPPDQNLHVFVSATAIEDREYKRKRGDVPVSDIPWGVELLKTETGKTPPSSLYLTNLAKLYVQVMPLPATARSSTTRSLLCYSTRLFASSRTDVKKPPQSEHSPFLTNLPFRLADRIRRRPNGGQRPSPCFGTIWVFDFMARRFLTPDLQPTGTSRSRSCRQPSGDARMKQEVL